MPPVCNICFCEEDGGVACDANDHFFCNDCINAYVSSTLCDNAVMVAEAGKKVVCPKDGCNSKWSNKQLLCVLTEDVLAKYMDVLCSLGGANEPAVEAGDIQAKILDALTISCPSCSCKLDPSPDGCCAMTCPTCGAHFCWICHHIAKDNNSCHAHVQRCPMNASKDLFPPKAQVDANVRRLQVFAIQLALSTQFGLAWRTNQTVISALEAVNVHLQDNKLTPQRILSEGGAAGGGASGGGGAPPTAKGGKHCSLCKKDGHTKQEHKCHICGFFGHLGHHCKNGGGAHGKRCSLCNKAGHTKEEHKCHSCGLCGHLGHLCQNNGAAAPPVQHCTVCNKEGHTQATHKCANCGGLGHGKPQCKSAAHCTICKKDGHTKATHKCSNCGLFGHRGLFCKAPKKP